MRVLLIILVLIISGCVSTTTYTVERVIDGDTFLLDTGAYVRLNGINTPEHDEPHYEEAVEALIEMVEGKEVTLERDVRNKDDYGRLLRYVFADGIFVNLELVRMGYARSYILKPNEKYRDKILEYEAYAQRNKLGIWSLN